jgi:phosphate starvation-inducible protein PhoH and related proteins
LTEKIFRIEKVNPIRFFGTDNANLKILKTHFPKLKITSRGDEIKVGGTAEEIDDFDVKLQKLLDHLDEYPSMSEDDIVSILINGRAEEQGVSAVNGGDVIVYGPRGLMVRARTKNQKVLVESSEQNDIVFARLWPLL